MVENASFDVLVNKIGPDVFAVGDDKKKGNGMKGKVHKVTRRYNSVICGADTPAAIPIKFGMHAACHTSADVTRVLKFSLS